MEDYIYELAGYLPITFGDEENDYFKGHYILAYNYNLEQRNYQLAYLCFHILFMTTIYKQFWFHKQYDYETVRNICSINPYKDANSLFYISADGEANSINHLLSRLGFDLNQRKQVVELVTMRDQCAHAYGKIYFREAEDIEPYCKKAVRWAEKIQSKSKDTLLKEFDNYLYAAWDDSESFRYKFSSDLAKEVIVKLKLSVYECKLIIQNSRFEILNKYKDNDYASKYLSLLAVLFSLKTQINNAIGWSCESEEAIDSWQLSLLGEFIEKTNELSLEEMKLFQVEYEDELNHCYDLGTLSSNVLSIAISMFIMKSEIKTEKETKYDFYISYAHEDGSTIAQSLSEKLIAHGITVWFDKKEIFTGDNIRQMIDKGLSESKYGIVILTEYYFRKAWTNYELDALTQKQMVENKIILPIWHNVTKEEVMKYSPSLANLMALKTSDNTIDEISDSLLSILNKH